MLTIIKGAEVNTSHPSLNYKNFKALQKNDPIFSHLPEPQKTEAQKLLWEALGSKDESDVIEVETPVDTTPKFPLEIKADTMVEPETTEEIKEG